MNAHTALCLAATAALAGCGPDYNGVDSPDYVNENNGRTRVLSLARPPRTDALVDAPSKWRVRRAPDGAQWCRGVNFPRPSLTGLPNGSIPSEVCADAAPTPTVVEVTSASCAQGACDVVLQGDAVVVTGRAAGLATLSVTARMSSGPDLTDTFSVEFVKAHAFEVRCNDVGPCGPHAFFTGTWFQWYVRLEKENGMWIDAPHTLTAEPADAVEFLPKPPPSPYGSSEPTSGWDTWYFRVLRPGNVTLTARAGTMSWSHTIRVVGFDEAVSGAVHHVARDPDFVPGTSNLHGPFPDTAFSPVGPVATELDRTHRLLLVWTLADGTKAIGTQRTSKGIASRIVPDWTGLEWEAGDLFMFELAEYPCKPGTETLSGGLGAGGPNTPQVNATVTLTCQ